MGRSAPTSHFCLTSRSLLRWNKTTGTGLLEESTLYAPGIGQRAQNLGDDFCHLKTAIFGRPSNYTARTATLPTPVTQEPIMSSQTMATTMVGRRDHDR